MQKSAKVIDNFEKKDIIESLRKKLADRKKDPRLQNMYSLIKEVQEALRNTEEDIRGIDEQLGQDLNSELQLRLTNRRAMQLEFINRYEYQLESMNNSYEEAKAADKKNYKLMVKLIKNLEASNKSKIKDKPFNEAYQKFEEFYT